MLSGITDEDKFDTISGIGPAIAVQQSIIRQSNPRSTVGSRTNILNMLGVLYSGEGRISCSSCGTPVDDNLTCEKCGNTEERLPATYFSYNSPNGMCMKCSGRGSYFEINMKKLVPNNSTTLDQVFDTVIATPGYANLLYKKYKDYIKTPFWQIPDEVKEEILYGHHVNSNYQKRSYCLTRLFQGRLYQKGEDSSGIYAMSVCSECNGFRIGEEARRVFLNGSHIGELGKMTIAEIHDFFEILLKQKNLTPFGQNLLKEILGRTNNLIKSRLGHLSLYREMPTLSGGEIQRLFLNSHLESKMDSLIYILDEPTIGLHESEKAGLLKSINALKELGNTVIVVEHDKNTIEMAEHIIDIGPKAGIEGGQVIYQGDFAGLLQCNESITGQYLSGKVAMPARTINQNIVMNKPVINKAGFNKAGFNKVGLNKVTSFLTIRHVKTNNLKDVTVSFPLGVYIGIAGVSGSGKSSLISDTLIPLLKGYFHDQWENGGTDIEETEMGDDAESALIETVAGKPEGVEHISGYAEVSQAPIGRHMNSNPVSYIGIWDKIRKLFASQPEAIEQKLSAGHFSFNSKGACSVCGGSGSEKIWLGGNFNIHNTCANVRLFRPLGMREIPDHKMKSFLLDDVFGKNVTGWIKDPDGNTTGGWGLVITPRDMARFGFLYLNRGVWDNTQIISDSWIDKATALNSNKYGYLWWLREENGTFTFAALGSGGNLICCIPGKDMVVTIASKIVSKPRDRWLLIEKCILPAIID